MSDNIRPFIGARFFHPTLGYLAAVAVGDDADSFIYIDLNNPEISDQPEGQVFRAEGMVIASSELNNRAFASVLPIEPMIGDFVAILGITTSAGSTVYGTLIDITSDSATIVTSRNDYHTGSADKVLVLLPTGEGHDADLSEGDTAVYIDLYNEDFPYGSIFEIVENFESFVTVRADDGGTYVLPVNHLVPYKDWEVRTSFIGVANAGSSVDEQADSIDKALSEVRDGNMFGADFVSAAAEGHPLAGYDPLTHCFSSAELSVLEQLAQLDPNLPTNFLGSAILQGRQISDVPLEMIINAEIPNGLGSLIHDPVEYFKEIGRISNDQSDEKLRRVVECIMHGGVPDLSFAAPSEIAFTRLTGISSENFAKGSEQNSEVVDVVGTLDSDDVKYATLFAENIVNSGGPLTGVLTDERMIKMAIANGFDPDGGVKLMYEIAEDGNLIGVNVFGEPVGEASADYDLGSILESVFGDFSDTSFDESAATAVEGGSPIDPRLELYDTVLPDVLEAAAGVEQDLAHFDENISDKLTTAVDYLVGTTEDFASVIEALSFVISKTDDPDLKRSLRRVRKSVDAIVANNIGGVNALTSVLKLRSVVDNLREGSTAIRADLEALVALK